jgi:hypothetical protein
MSHIFGIQGNLIPQTSGITEYGTSVLFWCRYIVLYLGLLILELVYEDVFSVWETIWAAKHIASSHFVLFIALALVESYRDIILSNSMDFTDIIKFFNGLY